MNHHLKQSWLKSKIGRRFAVYLTCLGLFISMLLVSIISYQQYTYRVSILNREVEIMFTSSKSLIEKALWQMDIKSLDLIIHGFFANNNIAFVRVSDENGETIITVGDMNNGNLIIKKRPLFYKDNGPDVYLGELTIAVSKDAAIADTTYFILNNFLQSVFLMCFISLSIIFIFWHLVSRHLITIQQYTRNIDFNKKKEPLKLDRALNKYTLDDELEATAEAINYMYNQAFNAYRTLERETTEKLHLEQQLRHVQKMESIGRLAGGIAHDFNNVLSIILGYADILLLKLSPTDPHYEQVKQIHEAGTKASALTRQLLMFSKKQVLEKKDVCINPLIKSFLKMLTQITGENIVIKTKLSEVACCVKGDPGQLEQVIMNLVINARDAMNNGGEITIETSEVSLPSPEHKTSIKIPKGNYLLLTISDNGEGIDKGLITRIFDPFFSTKPEGKGTGLGLATVYSIIKQHKGYIDVESQESQGTTFRIYLPCFKTETYSTKNTPAQRSLPKGKETILILDDNKSIPLLISSFLQSLNYNCLITSNPKDAIKLAKDYCGQIDLLLTDVVMPDVNGRDVAEKIRKIRPEIKVIFMSGYINGAESHDGFDESSINYITKPIDTTLLTETIDKLLHSNS